MEADSTESLPAFLCERWGAFTPALPADGKAVTRWPWRRCPEGARAEREGQAGSKLQQHDVLWKLISSLSANKSEAVLKSTLWEMVGLQVCLRHLPVLI